MESPDTLKTTSRIRICQRACTGWEKMEGIGHETSLWGKTALGHMSCPVSFLFLIYFYFSVCAGAFRGQKKTGLGLTGGHELPDLHAGNQLWSSARAGSVPKQSNLSSLPFPFSFPGLSIGPSCPAEASSDRSVNTPLSYMLNLAAVCTVYVSRHSGLNNRKGIPGAGSYMTSTRCCRFWKMTVT